MKKKYSNIFPHLIIEKSGINNDTEKKFKPIKIIFKDGRVKPQNPNISNNIAIQAW